MGFYAGKDRKKLVENEVEDTIEEILVIEKISEEVVGCAMIEESMIEDMVENVIKDVIEEDTVENVIKNDTKEYVIEEDVVEEETNC